MNTIGKNNYIHTYCITEYGMKNIKEINIGDKVYEYETGELIEVQDIKRNADIINEVHYNDGRVNLIASFEKIPEDFNINALEFKGLKTPLYPDANLAGAIFMYADLENDFVNLPLDLVNINNLFANKYKVQYANKLDDKNTAYFSFIDTPDEVIKWKDLFSDYKFYSKEKNLWDPMIPTDYVYSSIKDRMQFVMGAFDMGYDSDRFNGQAAIFNTNEDMLKILQKILWSLGILSKVKYSPGWIDEDYDRFHYWKYKRFYELRLLDEKKNYPGMFYEIDNIDDIIIHDDWLYKFANNFKLKVTEVKKYKTGFIDNLVFDKPRYFYTEDYLPRLSL